MSTSTPEPGPHDNPPQLNPPDDQTAEGWLLRYDRAPGTIPDWPQSRRMAVVMVMAEPDEEGSTQAFVMTSRAMLAHWGYPTRPERRLFFRVPRSILLGPEICPGLQDGSWVEEE